MSFRFIEDHRDTYPVRLMCAVLEVSPAGYYAWRERPVSARAGSNSALLAEIRQVHRDSGLRYGSPRVHAAPFRPELSLRALAPTGRRRDFELVEKRVDRAGRRERDLPNHAIREHGFANETAVAMRCRRARLSGGRPKAEIELSTRWLRVP
jgi:hypothetical protein